MSLFNWLSLRGFCVVLAILILVTKPAMAFANEPVVDVANCEQADDAAIDHRKRIIEFAQGHGTTAANKYLAAMRQPAKIQLAADGRSIRMEGRIDSNTPGSLARHLGHMKQLEILEVNSLGGDVAAAIDIAQALKGLNLTLVVDGYCMSSCANYLLIAAKRVILKGGLVGFHGGANACLESLGFFGGIRRLGIRRYMDLTSAAEKERRFLAGEPAIAAVIALSQKPDRGAMDGKFREWLLVHPHDIHELGVKNVELASTALFDDVMAAGEAAHIGRSHIWYGTGRRSLAKEGVQKQ